MLNSTDQLERQVTERLADEAMREYRAILRLIGERQCDSLGDFAMAEHLRNVLTRQQSPQLALCASSPAAT